MTQPETKTRYMKLAAGSGAVVAGIGAIGFALNGQFEAASASTQAAVGLFGLSGLFANENGQCNIVPAVLVPVPVPVTLPAVHTRLL